MGSTTPLLPPSLEEAARNPQPDLIEVDLTPDEYAALLRYREGRTAEPQPPDA